jgi:two-component system, sensor histidine kinase and response regulator
MAHSERIVPTLPAPGRAMRVLVAEDNIVNQRVASGLLRKRGHEVVVVGDGLGAVAATAEGMFDIVLMDVQMPNMDGFEATAAIREREATSGAHVRIVAMTAHAMSGDRDRCLRAGMDGYLSKPLDARLLCAVVEQDEIPRAAVSLAYAHETALSQLGGDARRLSEIIQLFLVDCPAWLATIKRAVDARDGAGICSEARVLKAAAGNLAALSLFEMAEIMEQLGADSRFAAADAAFRRLSDEATHVLEVLRRSEAAA